MIREFRDVFLSRLSGVRVTSDRERVPDRSWPAPWVVLDFPPPMREAGRWETTSQHRTTGWVQTACVGEDDDQAGWLHDKVADTLTDWTPTVTGWVVWPVRMDSNPRLLDWDTRIPDRRLVQVVTRWAFTAERGVNA